MEARANDLVERLRNAFPEGDTAILRALADKTDVTAKYIAQVHDLTFAEAVESLGWATSNFDAELATAIAAE